MTLRQYIKRHSKEILLLLLGVSLYFIGLWQLDLLCAPYVWSDKQVREILPFWYMYNTEAYVMFYGWIFLGTVLMLLSLWIWED